MGAAPIYAALTEGTMREHVEGLSDAERRALADHLGGATPSASAREALWPDPWPKRHRARRPSRAGA